MPWAKTDRRKQAARAGFAEQWPAPLANAAFHVICDGAKWQTKGLGYYLVRRKGIRNDLQQSISQHQRQRSQPGQEWTRSSSETHEPDGRRDECAQDSNSLSFAKKLLFKTLCRRGNGASRRETSICSVHMCEAAPPWLVVDQVQTSLFDFVAILCLPPATV